MTKNFAVTTKAWLSGLAALVVLAAAPAAFAQTTDVLRANIAFAFQAGTKTMQPGAYEFTIDREGDAVSVHGPKGSEAMEMIVTELAPTPHSTATDAHIVFDKVGTTYILSELWEPDMDGVLVHTTKGKHEHEVVHVKRSAKS